MDDFLVEIVKVSDDPKEVIALEEDLIRRNISDPLCINLHYGGCKSPELHAKSHIGRNYESLRQAMLRTNDFGLTVYQQIGAKMLGEKNPAKYSGASISRGRLKYTRNNREKVLADNKKIAVILDTRKDTDGKTAREKHSEWMLENNPTRETIWINDGQTNLRIGKFDTIPIGFKKGRLMKKQGLTSCPVCGKVGSQGNLKRYHFSNCKEMK